MLSPAEFVSQVRKELQRVTWPDKTETTGMAVAVICMVICAMLYFLVADSIVLYCVKKLIGI